LRAQALWNNNLMCLPIKLLFVDHLRLLKSKLSFHYVFSYLVL